MNDEMSLQEAMNLLNMINSDHTHPANNAMHPKHKECLLVYQAIENWINKHQITNKQPKYVYEKMVDHTEY
ncbi:unannotated protein [freshwater metagenome]|jgi:hypothetical protein|uniref:Unannotated protein n=1 Tax=freshwater metagenome TaxID=449393 RepID=A0A6J6ZP28_9ZZZZ|nr:hypothetical protein [Actinomycetota bacterium]